MSVSEILETHIDLKRVPKMSCRDMFHGKSMSKNKNYGVQLGRAFNWEGRSIGKGVQLGRAFNWEGRSHTTPSDKRAH